jgi:hypothetical protein
MLAAWLETALGQGPLPRVAPGQPLPHVHVLLVDGSMLLRAQLRAAAAAGQTLRLAVVELAQHVNHMWRATGADTVVVAFDVPAQLPLGCTARRFGGAASGAGGGTQTPMVALDAPVDMRLVMAPIEAVHWQWVHAATRALCEHLAAPPSASPKARAVLLDALPLDDKEGALEGARAFLRKKELALDAHAHPDLYAARADYAERLAHHLMASMQPAEVTLSFRPPPLPSPAGGRSGNGGGRRTAAHVSSSLERKTDLGEAVVKLGAWFQEHADAAEKVGLWSDHPDALVPAALLAYRWLCAEAAGASAGCLDLRALRARVTSLPRMAALVVVGLAAVGCSPLSPAEPAADGALPLVGTALRDLVSDDERARLGRPRLDLDALVRLGGGSGGAVDVDVAALVHLLAHVSHQRLAQLSPTIARRAGRASPTVLAHVMQQLRHSGEVPEDTAAAASLNTCLLRARRAHWLLRYYLARSNEDDQAWLVRTAQLPHAPWGWDATAVLHLNNWTPHVLARATTLETGWRCEHVHNVHTVRAVHIERARDMPLVPDELASVLEDLLL